jgi:hypothetical protein
VRLESFDFGGDALVARLAIFDRFFFEIILSHETQAEDSEEKNSHEPEPAFVLPLLHK